MKRFSIYGSVIVSVLVILLLSGCVTQTGSVNFNFPQDTLNDSEHLFVRYSNGDVSTGQNQSGQPSVPIQTYSGKTIVGGYVSDGIVSWVPNYSYDAGNVVLSGILAQKPTKPVDYVIQASQPVTDTNRPGFVDVTFAVYGTDGNLVDHQTEVFAHSTNSHLTFYNSDSLDVSGPGPGFHQRMESVTEGFSSYTVNGLVTFVIQSDISTISSKPISLYSGSKLIYDSNISPVIHSLAIGFASGDSTNNVTQNIALPTSGANVNSISWMSSNPDVVSSTGIVHPPSVGSGDANVTVTASVYSNGLFLSKPFNLLVKVPLPSDVASLSSLNLSGITLDQTMSGNVYVYTATVPNNVSVTSVTYTIADSHATVASKLNGTPVSNPISLSVGSNIISIVVTAQDGTINRYNITVNRAAVPTPTPTPTLSTNANLKTLQLSGAALDFSAGTTNYTVSVGNSVNSVTLSATADNTHATVKINSETGITKQINLDVGSNSVLVEVTAEDGTTKKTYNLTIKRAAAQTAIANVPIQVGTDPVSITVPAGVTNATIQVPTITSGTTKQATLPLVEVKASTSLGDVSISIPVGTRITAPSSWDGAMKLPEVQSNSSVVVSNGNVNAVIEVGSLDVSLTFDRAVRLLIPNQAGKSAGYVRDGVFTSITNTISADTQAAADNEITAGSDAKMDVGSDLVIWTKHFTKFVSYIPTTHERSNGSGGGGVPVTNTGTISASNGGTVNLNGVTIVVPVGAMNNDIKVTVDKVTDTSILPIDTSLKLISDVFEIKKDKDGVFSKPISITLPFGKNNADMDNAMIGIYWLNEETNKWIVLDNLQVDKVNATVTGSVTHFTKFAVLAAAKPAAAPAPSVLDLSDIKGHWAEKSIRDLIQLGAIDGYSDGTFKPSNNITRAEFVSVIVKAFHLTGQDGKVFADTANHWAKNAIATAAVRGIITGYSDATFGPDDLITREQMAVIMVGAAQIAATADGKSFTDSSAISDWAKAHLAAATSKGLLDGYQDGTLKPKGNTTRAEAATVIQRALALKK